jgi:hypothetical protein
MWVTWLATRAAFAVGLLIAHRGSRRALLPGDVAGVYFNAASQLVHGGVPYLGFHYEYPPGTLPVLALAWLLGGRSQATFVVIWCLLMLVFDAVITGTLSVCRFGVAAGYLWIVGMCLIGPTAVLRNDLVVVAAFAAAFMVTAEIGTVLGGALWMFGVLAKIWPLAPLAGLLIWRRRGRAKLAGGAAAVLALAAGALAFYGALGPMVSYLFGRQGRRPIEIESLWATPVWIKALIVDAPVHVVHTFGSENLSDHQGLAGFATVATATVQLACAIVPLVIVRRLRIPITVSVLAWILAVYVGSTLLTAPVVSPQYVLWLLGASGVLLGTVGIQESRGFVVVTLVSCGLTQLVFPALFTELQDGDQTAIIALLLRNMSLAIVVVLGVRGLCRQIADERSTLRHQGDPSPERYPGSPTPFQGTRLVVRS